MSTDRPEIPRPSAVLLDSARNDTTRAARLAWGPSTSAAALGLTGVQVDLVTVTSLDDGTGDVLLSVLESVPSDTGESLADLDPFSDDRDTPEGFAEVRIPRAAWVYLCGLAAQPEG